MNHQSSTSRCRSLIFVLCSGALLLSFAQARAEGMSAPAPEGAAVYFLTPADGAEVDATFTVRFGLRGMGIAPAGIDIEHTGHHHLLVDEPDFDPAQPLPSTGAIRHFSRGQTETELTLAPGEHRLELVFGDHLHVPHQPPVRSGVIRVRVRAPEPQAIPDTESRPAQNAVPGSTSKEPQ